MAKRASNTAAAPAAQAVPNPAIPPTTLAEIQTAIAMVNPTKPGAPLDATQATKAAQLLVAAKVAQAAEIADHDQQLRDKIHGYLAGNTVIQASGVPFARPAEVRKFRETAIALHAQAFAEDEAKAFRTVDIIVGVVAGAATMAVTGGGAAALIPAIAPLAQAFMDFSAGNDDAFDNLQPPTQ